MAVRGGEGNESLNRRHTIVLRLSPHRMNGLIPSAPARALMWPSPSPPFSATWCIMILFRGRRPTDSTIDTAFPVRLSGESSLSTEFAALRPAPLALGPPPPLRLPLRQSAWARPTMARPTWRAPSGVDARFEEERLILSVEPRYKTGLTVSLRTFRFRFISIALISTERFPFHSQIFYRHFVRVNSKLHGMWRDKGRIK